MRFGGHILPSFYEKRAVVFCDIFSVVPVVFSLKLYNSECYFWLYLVPFRARRKCDITRERTYSIAWCAHVDRVGMLPGSTTSVVFPG